MNLTSCAAAPLPRLLLVVLISGCLVAKADSASLGRDGIPVNWLIVAQDPDEIDAHAIARRHGGAVTREIPAIGVYTVTGDSGLGERLAATGNIRPGDIRIVRLDRAGVRAAGQAMPSAAIDDDFYVAGQWALDAIDAPEAWAAGHRGRGVRVAVLDTGIDPTHPDLAVNVNTSLATSFVAGQTWDVSTDPSIVVDHGTHIAGIIAAADNAFGIIGVAPEAEIVPVQVLSRPDGRGNLDAVIAGIVYAADIDADVINLSLAFSRFHRGGVNDRGTADPSDDIVYSATDAAAMLAAMERAVACAHASGATIVTGTSNEATDGNHDQDAFYLPRDATHVITVAATGPLGWGLDQSVGLDTPSVFSNIGLSVVDLSAPGGNLPWDLIATNQLCTVSSGSITVTYPCWFFDGVLSTAPVAGGFLYQFRAGTSQATAHASGIAALIIGKNGGSMNPDHVRARLRASAEDLGKPGKDEFYGHGRVNAYRAVR